MRAKMSSTYNADETYHAAKCIDGRPDGISYTDICHSQRQKYPFQYPFLYLEYDRGAKVSQVHIYPRKDGGGIEVDTKEIAVIVTDMKPLPGYKAEGIIISSQL